MWRPEREFAAALIILGLLTSCTRIPPASSTPSVSVASTSSTGSVTVATRLTPPPGDCLSSGSLLHQVPPWGALFGAAPAFGAFYARAERSAGSFHVDDNTRRTRDGWAVKVLWVLQPGTTATVALSGQEVGTGTPITFDPSNGSPSLVMHLDPTEPGTPSHRKGWSEYPSSLSFPESGCYVIKATWSGGSWQQTLGFGK
jgi:hypothetical protein